MESLMNLAIPKPAAPPDPRLACGCDIAALVDQALQNLRQVPHVVHPCGIAQLMVVKNGVIFDEDFMVISRKSMGLLWILS